MHEAAFRRRPLDDVRARKRLAARVHAHDRRCERNADPAADAPLAVHVDLHAAPGKDAARVVPVGFEALESTLRGAIALLDVRFGVGETQPVRVVHLWTNEHHRRAVPALQRKLLQRVHHHRGGAHVHDGEALRVRPRFLRRIGAADIHRNDHVGEMRRDGDGEIVHHATVDAGTVADMARREEAGQRARRIHRIADAHVFETREPPHHTRSAIGVNRVHEQALGQIRERPLGDGVFAQRPQRLLEVDGGGAHAVEQHAEVVHAKEIASPKRLGARAQVLHGGAAEIRGRDQRADARAGEQIRHDLELLEGTEDPDVRKAFQSPTAKDEGNPFAHVVLQVPDDPARPVVRSMAVPQGTSTSRRGHATARSVCSRLSCYSRCAQAHSGRRLRPTPDICRGRTSR